MADLKTLIEREIGRAGEPAFAFENLEDLRVRRHRTRRVTAAVVGLGVGVALILALVTASIYRSAPTPADPPEQPPVNLGVFEPIAGRIVYYENGSLWGVDPNASSPASTLVRLDLGRVADADRFASLTMPLGWSSDGTELLFLREDPSDDAFPYDRHLYILHADGTETQVTPDPVGSAAISPDGSGVAFAADGGGLYVIDAEGGQPVRIADVGESPTFSPDGTQIAYLSESGEAGIEHVWVANADGTDAHEILTDQALDMGMGKLTWSPAGDRLAMENQQEGHVAIYTFAPDGSDLAKVITGGFNHSWSPDGTQIAYGLPGRDGLSIADADGSNRRTLGVGGPGPWHPGGPAAPVGEDALDSAPSGFEGGWAAIDYDDTFLGDDTTPYQTMTIRAGEDGVLHVTVDDDSACVPDATAQTMTGTGRLEDSTTLVVPSAQLTCVEGSVEASERVELLDGYTLVLDPATDRIYDSLGVVWNRGAPAENWTGASTEGGVDGPRTFSILHGEVSFRAAEFWNDHAEAYIDPRLFFLIGPGDEGAAMTLLVNPLPPEDCESLRVPPSAEELVEAIRSNPDLEETAPVIERVGGIDALRMDVVAAPGASFGPCTAAESVDVVYVPGRPWGNVGPTDLGRLYVLDLPGGSARTLAILITAPSASAFELAVDSAAPVLDSFEFHAP